MASAEREPIRRSGVKTQGGPRAVPLVRGQGQNQTPETKSLYLDVKIGLSLVNLVK